MRPLVWSALCLLCSASALAESSVLRVDLAPELTCPRPEALMGLLSQRFGAEHIALGRQGAGELGLSLVQFPDALELGLAESPGSATTRRRLPLGLGSCEDMAETITLLADAWIRELRSRKPGSLWSLEGQSPPPAAPDPPPAPPPAASGAHAQGFALGELTLRLSGGASLGGDGSDFGAEARLSGDLTLYRRIGVALFASALQNVGAGDPEVGRGTISASRQTLSLAGRYAPAGDAETGLRLFAGLTLQSFEARAVDFTSDTSNFEVVPALFLAALWQQRIYGRLSAFAQIAAAVGPETDFTITDQGATKVVLAVSAATFDLSLGLALRTF